MVQPFHLPRFEHNTYHPVPEVGTGPEQDEAFDKVFSNDIAGPSVDRHSMPGNNYVIQEDDDDDLEEVEVLPATTKESSTFTQGMAPRSMLDLAKETEARQMEATNGDLGNNAVQAPLAPNGNGGSIYIEQGNKSRTRSTKKQNSNMKARRKKDGVRKNTERRRATTRRRNGTESPTSSPEISDLDGGFAIDMHDTDENGDDDARSFDRRSGSSKSALKRKRSNKQISSVPPESARVLRTRVPKTKEQIKAEQEAEVAFRRAIAE